MFIFSGSLFIFISLSNSLTFRGHPFKQSDKNI